MLESSGMTDPQPRRTFLVTRRKLDETDALVHLTPQQAWDQVDHLRRLQAELKGVPMERIQRVVSRRSLGS